MLFYIEGLIIQLNEELPHIKHKLIVTTLLSWQAQAEPIAGCGESVLRRNFSDFKQLIPLPTL